MNKTIKITPIQQIVARDGRPFGINMRMRSLNWLFPSVPAGALRTMIGKHIDGAFPPQLAESLKHIKFKGIFPFKNNSIYVPAPLDILVNDDGSSRTAYALKPADLPDDTDTDLPDGLKPLFLTPQPGHDFKPAAVPAFWSMAIMEKWLSLKSITSFSAPPDPYTDNLTGDFIHYPTKDTRWHVKIQHQSRTASEHHLFATTGLAFADDLQMISMMETDDTAIENVIDATLSPQSVHPMGGKRGLVTWRFEDNDILWSCPKTIRDILTNTTSIRMVLATPAIFSGGWKPGWLNDDNTGTPPGLSGINMKLIAAKVDRWQPVSGFSLEHGITGPKPVQRCVPAGSVYFFELEQPLTSDQIDQLWLNSVSDEKQFQRDGFGLSLWGIA